MNSKPTIPEELKENLKRVISLRDELQSIAKPKVPNLVCTLKEYGERLRSLFSDTDHTVSDEFVNIHHNASHRLERLMDISNSILNLTFKTSRKQFVSVMNDYINGLQKEFSKTE